MDLYTIGSRRVLSVRIIIDRDPGVYVRIGTRLLSPPLRGIDLYIHGGSERDRTLSP